MGWDEMRQQPHNPKKQKKKKIKQCSSFVTSLEIGVLTNYLSITPAGQTTCVYTISYSIRRDGVRGRGRGGGVTLAGRRHTGSGLAIHARTCCAW